MARGNREPTDDPALRVLAGSDNLAGEIRDRPNQARVRGTFMKYRFSFERRQLAGLLSALLLLGLLTFVLGTVAGVQAYQKLTGAETVLAGAVPPEDDLGRVPESTLTEPPAAPVPEVPSSPLLPESRDPEESQPRLEQPVPAPREISGSVSSRLAEIELHFQPSQSQPQTPYGELIYRVAWRHAMNPELVAAVVRTESAFDPEAVSARGARGLMQVLPGTARRFGIDAALLHEPEFNLIAGVKYLSWLSARFEDDPRRVLAAYNAGEGEVERYNGIPPFPETRDYLVRLDSLMHGTTSSGERNDG